MLQDERSSESDMDQGPSSSSSSSEDLTNLDDAEIVAHCIKKLKDSSGEVHLKWLQQQFCDVAYAKYGKIYKYRYWLWILTDISIMFLHSIPSIQIPNII